MKPTELADAILTHDKTLLAVVSSLAGGRGIPTRETLVDWLADEHLRQQAVVLLRAWDVEKSPGCGSETARTLEDWLRLINCYQQVIFDYLRRIEERLSPKGAPA